MAFWTSCLDTLPWSFIWCQGSRINRIFEMEADIGKCNTHDARRFIYPSTQPTNIFWAQSVWHMLPSARDIKLKKPFNITRERDSQMTLLPVFIKMCSTTHTHTHTHPHNNNNSKWLEQQRHFFVSNIKYPEVGQVPRALHKVPGHLLYNILGFALFYVYGCLNQARGNMAAVVPAITSDITTSK